LKFPAHADIQSGTQTIVVGVTGASGAVAGASVLRLLEAPARGANSSRRHRHGRATAGARTEHRHKRRQAASLLLIGGRAEKTESCRIRTSGIDRLGSYPVDALVVILARWGRLRYRRRTSDDLIGRAADVCLKEGRRLVLCVRDTPFAGFIGEHAARAAGRRQ